MELFANGVSLGVQDAADHFFYFDVPNAGTTHLVAVAGECKDESHIRKVEVFNEAYRLREKGAVLNWFDITEPEGYLSLNSTMGLILQTAGGQQLLGGIMSKMMPKKENGNAEAAGFELNESMMSMLGGFTLLRMITMAGGMLGFAMTKEQLLGLNAQLNQIPKP